MAKEKYQLLNGISLPKLKSIEEWKISQNMILRINSIQEKTKLKEVPIHKKSDPVPIYSVFEQHKFILTRISIPLLLHRFWLEFTQIQIHSIFAFLFYYLSLMIFLRNQSKSLQRMGKRYGYFDGNQERDKIPKEKNWKLLKGLFATTSLRSILAIFWIYDPTEQPSINWKTPFDIMVYILILDLIYYIFHRSLHEIPFLWKFHKTHHSIRHPMVHMAAYADEVQEWFDMVIVPSLTYCLFPLNFTSWFIATSYITYTEMAGHSGVRVYYRNPSLAWLRYFGQCELTIEDHDCHHQFGYRISGDYGKQSRLWDGLFGTKRKRIETNEKNLDWINTANTWGHD